MRTRKRRDPRMRQRTPGREKMPGRGFEVALVPRKTRQVGVEKVLGTEKPPVPAFPGRSRQWSPSLRHKCTDSDWGPPGLVLRQVNSTPAEAEPGIVREMPC